MARATSNELAEISYLTPEQQKKALEEIANRPQVIPLNQRKYPYGKPDRLQPGSNL